MVKSASLMQAAVLRTLGEPLDVCDDLAFGEPVRGQVLVRLAYSGVCHSQLMEVRGHRGADPYLPHLLGHEGTGVVVSTGEGVTKVKGGDRVVLGWIKGDGLDAGGVRYSCRGETVNAGGVTTFNQFALVSENRVVPLPDGVPMDVGVLFGCALPTGAGIVINDLDPRPNSTFVIFGLGGIGMSALIATQLYSPAAVIAVDISDAKLALAREFGATAAINSTAVDAVAEIRRLTGGAGTDYAVEASGRGEVIEAAFDSVRRGGGLCVFASHPRQGVRINLDPYELICGKQIRGSWGGACKPDRDIPRFGDLYRQGRLPLEKLLTHRYTLAQINQALDDLEHGRVGRPLIEINADLASATS